MWRSKDNHCCSQYMPFSFQMCCFVSKPERLKVDYVENRRQISHFLSPLKIRGGLGAKCLIRDFKFSLGYITYISASDILCVWSPLTHSRGTCFSAQFCIPEFSKLGEVTYSNLDGDRHMRSQREFQILDKLLRFETTAPQRPDYVRFRIFDPL